MIAPADAEVAKDATTPAETTETPVSPATKEKRRTSFFGSLGVKKEKKADTSDNEATTDGETKEKGKSSKLGGMFRKPSKAVKLEKGETAPTETEAKAAETTETAAEPAATEEAPVATTEETPKVVETTTAEEANNVNIPTSTPVQAAA